MRKAIVAAAVLAVGCGPDLSWHRVDGNQWETPYFYVAPGPAEVVTYWAGTPTPDGGWPTGVLTIGWGRTGVSVDLWGPYPDETAHQAIFPIPDGGSWAHLMFLQVLPGITLSPDVRAEAQ